MIHLCRQVIIATCLALIFAGLSMAGQEEATPLDIARQLKQRLEHLTSLSFTFTQRSEGQLTGRVKQASGKAYFYKDGDSAKMRWDYLAPDRQIIISNGEELRMYFENLNQMIIAPADTLQQDVTYSFFTGKRRIQDDFEVNGGEEPIGQTSNQADYRVIELIPKDDSQQVKQIRLWVVDAKTIKRIEFTDTFDTTTTINITNVEENTLQNEDSMIDSEFFTLIPPEGTEIIRQ